MIMGLINYSELIAGNTSVEDEIEDFARLSYSCWSILQCTDQFTTQALSAYPSQALLCIQLQF